MISRSNSHHKMVVRFQGRTSHKEFTLSNVIESLQQSLIEKPKSSMFRVAESSEQALSMIFGLTKEAA